MGPIVLFDGNCNFCSGSVNFIIRNDPQATFRFAALQSESARRLLEGSGIDADASDSVVLVDGAGVHTRSDAALMIAAGLRFPWRAARLFQIVPRFLRDGVYGLVAANRFRLFGRREECIVPTPDVRRRFLD